MYCPTCEKIINPENITIIDCKKVCSDCMDILETTGSQFDCEDKKPSFDYDTPHKVLIMNPFNNQDIEFLH
jgi:hypothetical protein